MQGTGALQGSICSHWSRSPGMPVSAEAELQREGAAMQESVCRVTQASHWEIHSGWGTGTPAKGAVERGEEPMGHHGEQTEHK